MGSLKHSDNVSHDILSLLPLYHPHSYALRQDFNFRAWRFTYHIPIIHTPIHPSIHPFTHSITQHSLSLLISTPPDTQSQPPPTNSKTLHPRIIDRTFTSLKFNPFMIVLTPSLPHPPQGGEDPQAQVRAWCEVVDAPAWTCEPSRSRDRLFSNVFVPMCIHIFASVSILICTFWLASLRFMDARLGFCAAPSS